jgi:four helix bundle protein
VSGRSKKIEGLSEREIEKIEGLSEREIEGLSEREIEGLSEREIEGLKKETALDRAKELQDRTKRFALRVVRMFRSLPRADEARIMGKQVLRSATSMAANYRAACRARSKAEFVAKIGVVVEEADETVFWLELLVESDVLSAEKAKALIEEANELLAIVSASQRTARGGNQ